MATLRAWGAIATLALTMAGCSPFGSDSFECDTTEQCGPGGTCESATHYCSFSSAECGPDGRAYGQYSGELAGQCTGQITVVVDAPPDDPPPASCNAGEQVCFGNAIETCKADETGYDPAQRVPCALACDSTATGAPTCYQASGIPVVDQVGCGSNANDKDLQAGAGATVTIHDDQIECENCAGGVTAIPKRGTNPNNWFCVKSLMLGAGVDVRWETSSVVTIFVAQSAVIDTTIDFSGHDGSTLQSGGAGPGGFNGAGLSNAESPGRPGTGPCAGGGGGHGGAAATSVGGGGGGAGGAGAGGAGGSGGAGIATAGTGGVTSAQCDAVTVQPLRGGSGGGGGGDGACGVGCGATGGGGGGAIQIAVRGDLSGSGQIQARGGDGANSFNGTPGGGGGGAGGNVLLEARAVTLAGQLDVSGGDGGRAANRNGGRGDQGTAGTAGTNGPAATDGGAGGGGASGRIRVNALSAPNACSAAKPAAACSPGALKIQGS